MYRLAHVFLAIRMPSRVHWVTTATVLVIAAASVTSALWPRGTLDRPPTRPRSGPGDAAPDFTLPDTDGANWTLHEHLGGDLLLLEFMDIDCDPCITVIPDLINLSRDYADNLTVVSLETNLVGCSGYCWVVALFREEYATPWTYLIEGSGHAVSETYDVVGVPTFVLIGADGVIAYRYAGLGDMPGLRAALDGLLAH